MLPATHNPLKPFHVCTRRSNAAGRSMSIMRGFNISLKSRALTASMRSRVSKVGWLPVQGPCASHRPAHLQNQAG